MKLSIISLLVGTVLATQDSYRVFEKLSAAPEPWTLKDDAQTVDQNLPFKLRVHLKNRNIASFKQQVLDVSTPSHPSYGRHLSREEVNSMIAPSNEAFAHVMEWLESYNLSSKATVESDWIVIDSTIGEVETLLDTKYEVFENSDTGKKAARTLAYSLPASLHAYVDIVAPTIKFSAPKPQLSTIVKDFEKSKNLKAVGSLHDVHDGLDVVACNSSITVDCLQALYKFKHFRGSRRNGNQIGLAGFLEEYAQHDDLEQFYRTYVPDAYDADFQEILINGGLNTQDATGGNQSITEANLDIQYGAGLAYPTPSIYFSTGGRPPETVDYELDNEPYLEFLTYLLAMKKIPQTISISYGDSEWGVPASYAHTVCDLFAQVAARGVTVLASSGDSGSGDNCTQTNPNKLLYTPAFPASCPWVTAVGGTRYVNPELAVSFSGGGFSDFFPRPSWQNADVSSWLSTKADPKYTQYFNASGRAYPDISAQGVNFHTILEGEDGLVSGTSASAPAFAAVVALLNGDRISNGLAPFGFLNPWLYSKGKSGLTDIVGGKGRGCLQIPGSGFPAVAGWDPVSGLGTPDFPKLRLASTGIKL
ncbi:related to Tripeptidyl-peptidase sed3 [Rhynchosporium secalis]|uniref:tripeptidyl-peptidase II n=1 Tax=Rhynchosporium secalis TaxID=38038 RepID=A0A1E1MHD6_RHYSE|nr:related to Tripeptidyl-peptidase sed3 [Rhynchosporium secalis]